LVTSARPASDRRGLETPSNAPKRFEKISGALPAEKFELFAALYADLHERAEQSLAAERGGAAKDPSIPHLIVVPERGSSLICRTEFLAGSSPALAQAVDALITPLIERFVGEPVALFKDKCNEKSPGGGAFQPHQDIEAYRHFPARNFFTAMVPLDPSTLENGCLQVSTNMEAMIAARPELVQEWIAGNPLLPHEQGGPQNGVIEAEASSGLNWEAIELARGDILIFDSYLPHYSEPNLSPHRRRALFLTYNRKSEGEHYDFYYRRKREDAKNPIFHVATPTDFDEARKG
jgi:ectoine hydroxylase-related dioxygenase (phytanoyl-CoA dioxygenase family)